MENVKSLKFLRRRKLFLILPLLALPFVTIIFWALGGGRLDNTNATPLGKSFNLSLPDPKLNDGQSADKMTYYDQAALDSIKREELIRKDPNYTKQAGVDSSDNATDSIAMASNRTLSQRMGREFQNPSEQKVYQKLAALKKAIGKAPGGVSDNSPTTHQGAYGREAIPPQDIDRLEQMMRSMNESDSQDPELQQLSGMLENILDIQHPERAVEKMRKASEKERGQVMTVSTTFQRSQISSFQASPDSLTGISEMNGFYSLAEVAAPLPQNAVLATVHETQTVINGSTVKLRLSNDIFINGVRIPKDNFIYGTASLKGERLGLKINSLRYGNSIFPVDLSVYDMDGLDGIYIPGAISRDVAKASADRSMQNFGVTTLDDSWGAQAAGAGIEAAKTLFSKKVKLIKVVVKAGYRVLLRDEKQKQKDSH